MERGGKISVEVLEEGQKDGHWRRRELRWERKKVWEKDKGREEEKGKKKKKIGHQGDARETEKN